MTSVYPHLATGPRTFKVSADVDGGQVVQYDGDGNGTIEPAGADSVVAIGVALTPAEPAGSDVDTHFATPRPETAVCYAPHEVKVTYEDAATEGAPLKCAAAGAVTPMVLGTDAAHLQIGICTEAGGVLAGAKGLMRLTK